MDKISTTTLLQVPPASLPLDLYLAYSSLSTKRNLRIIYQTQNSMHELVTANIQARFMTSVRRLLAYSSLPCSAVNLRISDEMHFRTLSETTASAAGNPHTSSIKLAKVRE
jgi:hypothetical protein